MGTKWLHRVCLAVLVVSVVLAPASLNAIAVPGSVIGDDPQPVQAGIDIKPETLNIRSNGIFSVIIELPPPKEASMIDPGTVAITHVAGEVVRAVLPARKPPVLGDCDGDGVADLRFQFRRCDLKDVLTGPAAPRRSGFELTVSGQLADGTPFEGTVRLTRLK